MKNFIILLICIVVYTGCHKANVDAPDTFPATEQTVLNDFTNDVALKCHIPTVQTGVDLTLPRCLINVYIPTQIYYHA